MNHKPTWFQEMLAAQGITLSERQLEQFELYYQLLVEWNEKMNLTGITEREAVYEKHFYDSISLSFYIDVKGRSLADIGSGAGFPSLPLKICYPDMKIMIVDALNKRIQFLKHVVERLGLDHVQCVHGRAEDIARLPEHRDHYDFATARAVARLNVLAEFCLPFVRQNGLFIAMKGTAPDEELVEATASLQQLKGKLKAVHPMKLPFEQSDRHMIVIDKIAATPKKFPRKAGLPLKQPIT
ncbi:16S rRNA (guanine(527)-N(7))-methyltransferase RsmG [Paenibacillus sp. GCM10027626]|uniref:16S rRNA (guanine(527)-N(7))-methyltransferase RsmG n=1 Tax=Paenibacillus sp. GCM10027626 TaxID=3273411 RepID=UPI0036304C95